MRRAVASGAAVVVKIGSSSLSKESGGIDPEAIERVVEQVAQLASEGHPPVLVTSGAISAGLPVLGRSERPSDIAELQVAASVGQTALMERYVAGFAAHGLTIGQVLLTKDVLGNRAQYLNARAALERMLALGIVPVVNENDSVVVDEVRVGDNDQLAAIASHLVNAGMLVILTDTPGLFNDDPRFAADAKLLDAVVHTDRVLDEIRLGVSARGFGSGGVATKVTAARMAAFSGVPTVITSSTDDGSVAAAIQGLDTGTWVDPSNRPLPARKLWIAFGLPSAGALTVDQGAAKAISTDGRSLLAVGLRSISGDFARGEAVEVLAEDGPLLAKGVVRIAAEELVSSMSDGTTAGKEAIHRDDLVVLS
ncbi:MAG: glutamate 5-kinase [Acidimicrobiia bacterium]